MRADNLGDWLLWLEQQFPESGIELGLDRVGEVAARLSLLKPKARVITVAGTNGKGSCAAALESLLLDAGLSVGVFTSPHFVHYCERIRLNGEMATEETVCTAFTRIDAARLNTDPALTLTYFEFGALAALDVFARSELDVIVLEVGLGGRLDAVNIIDADVAIVTSIAVDHEEWLGSDREIIGREKAGIMRSGRVAICADYQAPNSILEVAEELGANLLSVGEHWSFESKQKGELSPAEWSLRVRTPAGGERLLTDLPLPNLPLPSVAAAIQALESLSIELPPARLNAILPSLELTGRYQKRLFKGRQFVLDVAHNPAAAQLLSERLSCENSTHKPIAIVGMMSDKDRQACLECLTPQVDQWLPVSLPHIPRAASAADLHNDLESLGVDLPSVRLCDTVARAIDIALEEAQDGQDILIMGSFFTVAGALKELDHPMGTEE